MEPTTEDKSMERIGTGRWKCLICQAEFNTRSKDDHPMTTKCLQVLLVKYREIIENEEEEENEYEDMEWDSNHLTLSDLQKRYRETKKDDNWYSFNLNIDNTNRSWHSKYFDKCDKTWQFEATMARNKIDLYLVLQPTSSCLELDLKITMKVNNGEEQVIRKTLNSNQEPWVTFELPLATTLIQVKFDEISTRILDDEEPITEKEESQYEKKFREKYNNAATRLVNDFVNRWEGNTFTRDCTDELLQLIKVKVLREQETPLTSHLLRKTSDFFYNKLPKDVLKVESDGRTYELRYNTIQGIVDHVISSPIYTQGWVSKSDKTNVDHPCSREAWSIYEEAHADRIASGHQLLLPVIWTDKYSAQQSRKKSFCSVLLTFANLSKEVLMTQQSRFLICTIPPHLMDQKDFILDEIVVHYMAKLEDGSLPKMKFSFLNNEVPVCGGLYAIKGDHMEKTQLAGIVGPGGDVPSFYTKTTKEDITNVDKEREFRSRNHTMAVLRIFELQDTATDQRLTTQVTGVKNTISPFWKLIIFSRDFYMRFAICPLHLLHLGLVKRYVDEIGMAMKKPYRDAINERTKEIPPSKDMTRITMPVYKKKKDKTNGLTGRMWSTFTKVSTSLNADLLDESLLKRWSFIMEGFQTIDETEWTLEQLDQGGKLDTLCKDILTNILRSFDGFDEKPNWNIPNFETMYAVAKSVQFLGPLWFQSTDIEEGTNKFYRNCIRVSNQINAHNHMLNNVDRKLSLEMVKFDSERARQDYDQIKHRDVQVKSERIDLDGPRPEPLHITELMKTIINEDLSNLRTTTTSYELSPNTAFTFNSIYLSKRKYHVTDEPAILYKNNGEDCYGLLTQVNEIKVKSSASNETGTVTAIQAIKFLVITPLKDVTSIPNLKKRTFQKKKKPIRIYVFNDQPIQKVLTKLQDYKNAQYMYLV